MSISASATSYLPSKSDATRKPELGVYPTCTVTPLASKKPWRCAAHNGRFQPPSNVMTRISRGEGGRGASCAFAPVANANSAAEANAAKDRRVMACAAAGAVAPNRED
ncbi:MAG: hypothetical protein ACHP91_15265, partial [Burkholderiales bacterium]